MDKPTIPPNLEFRRRRATVPAIVVLAGITWLMFLTAAAAGQTTAQLDPFYLRNLESGVRAFEARNYAEAAQGLEVAVFGLAPEPRLAGKAYLYLSACRFILRERDKSREAMVRAFELLGPRGLIDLGVSEASLAVLRGPVEAFQVAFDWPVKAVPEEKPKSQVSPSSTTNKPADGQKPGREKAQGSQPTPQSKPKPVKQDPPAVKAKPPADSGVKDQPPAASPAEKKLSAAAELENLLRSDPANPGPVYDLSNLHFRQKNFKEARRILRAFLLKRPGEVAALFYLAKANYFLQDYGAALESFHKISDPFSQAKLGRELTLKTYLYIALCLNALKQVQSVSSFLAYVEQNSGPEELAKIIEEEGLQEPWQAMRARLGKPPAVS